jgi:hypothetical protein
MGLIPNKGTGYVGRRAIRSYAVGAGQLDDGLYDGSFTHVVGDHTPRSTTGHDTTVGGSSNAAPTGAAADVNRVAFSPQLGHLVADTYVIGTQTILGPVRHALGINFSQDATNNDGIHYTFGGIQSDAGGSTPVVFTNNPFAHTVGTTGDSVLKIKAYIEDADGTDQCIFGWRKQELETNDPNDFNDMAAFGDLSALVKTMEIQTNAPTVTSASLGTLLDATAHTWEVRVKKNGRVSYFLDNVQLNPGTTYQFTAGLVLVPFMCFIQDTNVTEAYFQDIVIGRQYSIDTDRSSEDRA